MDCLKLASKNLLEKMEKGVFTNTFLDPPATSNNSLLFCYASWMWVLDFFFNPVGKQQQHHLL